MSRYDYTDSIIKYLNKKYIELFGKLNSVLAIDEVHVLSQVNATYQESDKTTREAFLLLAQNTYNEYSRRGLRSLDDEWVDELLESYDPTTKYVYAHEVERKAARCAEAVISTGNTREEIKNALRYYSAMNGEYAVIVTLAAQKQAYKDDEEDWIMWNTQKDGHVCRICQSRDGEIYEPDEYPARPHWGCRCYPKSLGGD
jgi:hypothetical protein